MGTPLSHTAGEYRSLTFLGRNPSTKTPNKTAFPGISEDGIPPWITGVWNRAWHPAGTQCLWTRTVPTAVWTRVFPAVLFRMRKTGTDLRVHQPGFPGATLSIQASALKPLKIAITSHALKWRVKPFLQRRQWCVPVSGERSAGHHYASGRWGHPWDCCHLLFTSEHVWIFLY